MYSNLKSSKAVLFAGLFSLSVVSVADMASPGVYKFDPGHSSVMFSVNHLGTSELQGRFNEILGGFTITKGGVSGLEASIKTSSIDTNHVKRDKHLRGPDFFNVKQYPDMRFTSTQIIFNKSSEPEGIVGDLSLHGETKSITFDVDLGGAGVDPWGKYRAGFKANTMIKRSDFGMNYMPEGIGNDISIVLHIEAIKQ